MLSVKMETMELTMKKIEKYKREALFANLKEYDCTAKEHSYIEVIEWKNGEGIDVNIYNHSERMVSICYSEFDLIKKMVKKLNKL